MDQAGRSIVSCGVIMIRAFFGSTSEQALRNYDIDCDGQINPQPKARESTDTIFRPPPLTHTILI